MEIRYYATGYCITSRYNKYCIVKAMIIRNLEILEKEKNKNLEEIVFTQSVLYEIMRKISKIHTFSVILENNLRKNNDIKDFFPEKTEDTVERHSNRNISNFGDMCDLINNGVIRTREKLLMMDASYVISNEILQILCEDKLQIVLEKSKKQYDGNLIKVWVNEIYLLL